MSEKIVRQARGKQKADASPKVWSLADQLMYEGRQEGLSEGRQEGLNEGRDEGRHEGMTRMLLEMVGERFEEVPETLEQRIRAMTDEQQIKQTLRKIMKVSNLEELIRETGG